MQVSDETRQGIVSHYRTYAETYDRIWSNLDAIYERFEAADRREKTAYLKLSYVSAVLSIKTRVSLHEEAMERLMAGDSLETAIESVNYHRQKRKYMRRSLRDDRVWKKLVSTLESGDVDRAHEIALDRLDYIGTVKAPFLLAMLGYTEKMCFDSNVVRVTGLDDHPSTSDVREYERMCRKLRGEFPVLSEEIDPFHPHWIIFDWQRYASTDEDNASEDSDEIPVTSHDAWFDAALNPPPKIERIVGSLT